MKKLVLLCSFGLLGSFAFAGNSVESPFLIEEAKAPCVITTTTTTTTTHPDGSTSTTTQTTTKPCPKVIIVIEG